MQKIKLRQWMVALVVLLAGPRAYASDYGFWFPALILSAFFVPIGLGLAGLVLIYKDVQDDSKDKFTWKFYVGVTMLLPEMVALGLHFFYG
jgi:hypothetical protein